MRRRRNIKKSVVLLLCMALLLCCIAMPAFADEHQDKQPDYSRNGSVTLDIKTATGKTVGGGTLTVYRIADAVYENGDNLFVLTDAFDESGTMPDKLISPDGKGLSIEAEKLSIFTRENHIDGVATVTVGDDGHAAFTDLPLGMYLIVQETAPEDYEPINPFLITVPFWDGEKLVYDVSANPKLMSITGMAKYDPPVEKLVEVKNGKAPTDSEFIFKMRPNALGYPMPENDEAEYDPASGTLTMKKHGPGSYEFGWMYFGTDHVGKTYTYTIYEAAGDDAHYKYDTMIYILTIVVNQDPETKEISLDISYADPEGRPADAVKFTNVYTPSDNPPPSPPPDKLPQTGQLWWPVPVLALAGVAMLIVGIVLRRKSEKQ